MGEIKYEDFEQLALIIKKNLEELVNIIEILAYSVKMKKLNY